MAPCLESKMRHKRDTPSLYSRPAPILALLVMAAATADAVFMETNENPNENEIAFVLDSFVDGPEINELIERLQLIHDNELAFEGLEERFRFLFDKYQEQPHLLDKSLGKLLEDLLRIAVAQNSPQTLTNKCFKLMYIITKVRNYKNVVGHLPHEVCIN